MHFLQISKQQQYHEFLFPSLEEFTIFSGFLVEVVNISSWIQRVVKCKNTQLKVCLPKPKLLAKIVL